VKRRNFSKLVSTAGLAAMGSGSLAGRAKQPNLLIIHTDEHNFRTLGCYREILPEDQAFVWGKGVKVDTPNIDSIAHEGALCTNFYASSPVCTPSRASFVSGLYPVHTGSPANDMPMHDHIVTFAEILRRKGYATSYLGKWHLDGEAKPGFAPKRKFGFEDNRYMFNRGHWKLLKKSGNTAALVGEWKNGKYKFNLNGADPSFYTTDFLTDRALEVIERDKTKPFCIMLSFPDPHGPNAVREPYSSMFKDMYFQHPRTMDATSPETAPKWLLVKGKNWAGGRLNQQQMQWYFGMVKCIDDNIGRILKYLKSQGLEKNTIVIFTSDHGDLMGEHNKHNKGNPFEGSARIPFVIRYPGKIRAGKIIHTAFTTVDFSSTILSMMGAPQIPETHGMDASAMFLGREKDVKDDRIVYITNAGGRWVCAVNHRYKLVLSPSDHPWLFDKEKDPDELTNFYNDPAYKDVAAELQAELMRQMKRYKEPALEAGNLILDSTTPIQPSTAKGKTKKKWVGKGTVLQPQQGEYLIDAANLSVRATNAGVSSWNRACIVPAGSFAPGSAYELMIDWKSEGLGEESVFYANFTGDKSRKQKQIKTWKGAVGETGTLTAELVTDNYKQWQLAVGVRGPGSLIVKRIRIRKKQR